MPRREPQYRWAGIDSIDGVDVSPFDPATVYVWATTKTKALARAKRYFKNVGFNLYELTARHTGLTAPSQYRDENVAVNEWTQDPKLRQDYPSMKRYSVQPSKRKG